MSIGLTYQNLDLWLRGSPSLRKDVVFNNMLRRIWTALFAKEVCVMPPQFEALCRRFGFDRGTAMEKNAALASRCSNLRNFCMVRIKYKDCRPPVKPVTYT